MDDMRFLDNREAGNKGINAFLSPSDSILVYHGLVVEYAPGCIVPRDFAAHPALRGSLLIPELGDAVAITLTATWVHTGWIPPHRLPRLYAAHPTRVGPTCQ